MSSPIFQIKEHVVECQHIQEYPRATSHSREAVLHLAVKQYTPLDNLDPQPGDLTIIAAHANGFPKELYEPLWDEIHARSTKHGFRIRGIWIADKSNQGASYALNEHLLGDDPSWFDHSRDLLHMINVFRKEMPRPLMGVGHSMGGGQLAHLSSIHPSLFSSIVFLDPVFAPVALPPENFIRQQVMPAQASTVRRDLWPSRESAYAAFAKSKFYQSWDPRVLARWKEFGIRETPTAIYPDCKEGEVTLATPKHQEVFVFMRPRFVKGRGKKEYPDLHPLLEKVDLPFYRPEPGIIFARIDSLRPSALYIFGDDSYLSSPDARKAKLELTGTGLGGSGGMKEGRVAGVSLKGVGHLVAMEDVEGCAEPAAKWIGKEIEIWRKDQEEYLAWTKKPQLEKLTTSEEWKEKIKLKEKSPTAKL